MFAIVGKPRVQPSFRDGFARSPGESVAPELWPAHAWVPALGCQGGMLFDVAGGNHGTNTATWGYGGLYNTGNTGIATQAFYKNSKFTFLYYGSILSEGIGTRYGRFFGSGANTYPLCIMQYDGSGNGIGSITISISGTLYSVPKEDNILPQYNHVFCVTYFPGRLRAYHNGKLSMLTNLETSVIPDTSYMSSILNNTDMTRAFDGVMRACYMFSGIALTQSQVSQLSLDPLLPFRRRKPVFYSLPAAGFKTGWYRKPILIGGGLA